MILDVDMGNTRIKWLFRQAEDIVDRGVFAVEDAADFFVEKCSYKPQRIRVASVRSNFNQRFNGLCEQYWQLQPEYAMVTRRFGSVVNAYDDISQMGVDRWMGIVAASALYNAPCVVVSVGSAMTVDLLRNKSDHLGGFIVPGLQLMRQSLYRDTDQVKLVNIDYDSSPEPGRSTLQAVSSGVVLMQLGLLQQSLQLLNSDNVNVIITGGDGQRLHRAMLDGGFASVVANTYYEPDLVFKGLSLVL